MTKLSTKDIEIYDELNKIQIDQLHKATLNFSDNSLETKKLCVTVESAVLTLLAGIYKNDSIDTWIKTATIFCIIIPILFYLVDSVLWFYQNRLREKMLIEENEIRARHGLVSRNIEIMSNRKRVFKSLFNGSQIMYLGLVVISVLIRYFV